MAIRMYPVMLVSLVLAPLSANAQTSADTGSPARGQPAAELERQLLGALHQMNLMEIEAGRLASVRGKSAGTKQFAADLTRDHSLADVQVFSLARQLSVALVPPDTSERRKAAEGQAMLESLKTLQGEEFDRAFARMMADDHKQAIELVRSAQPRVITPALSNLLDQLLPVLERHRDSAMALVTVSSR